jgi:serine/threonine protein kinase
VSALSPELDYAAPELVEGSKCDPLSDIFSLGVFAFATFNKGKPLFDSQNSFVCYRKNFETVRKGHGENINCLLFIFTSL